MKKIDQSKWLKKLEGLNYSTPFMVTDRSVLINNAVLLKKLFSRIHVYYAIKSASNNEIISALDDHVDGFDIASLGEFRILKNAGIDPQRIFFSNPVKIDNHISECFGGGVKYFSFDSVDELQKLALYAPGSNVYLRIKVSDYGSKFPLSKKFGAEEKHAVSLMGMAKDLGLNPIGLTFHVGSQSESPQTWEVAIEKIGKLINKLISLGIDIKFLNIGGGLPVEYVDRIPSLKTLSKYINKSLSKHIPQYIDIYMEPGRNISAGASIIVSKVIGKAHRSGDDWLYLDMGVFQGLMECLEIQNWRLPIFTEKGNGSLPYSTNFVITGPSCDAYDTIGFDYMLPPNIKTGDKIYIGMAGAYTSVYESSFNGFDPPSKYYI